ncbi:major facilitator superfamily domain-containing protein [Leucosporidium creatinivorum]|uniref:Major facilitator superfamily domain-containing protein n=1 Tax=Leucosporidium creatinivorum TaxID=106004 RepID=A0A1Y2EYD9_9BASI|nr:major facilitator superfamily domain-containing protein [Leucosporidium creatinivorum]
MDEIAVFPLNSRPLSLHSTTESKLVPHLTLDAYSSPSSLPNSSEGYRLYRRRFSGCFSLVLLNIICAMNWFLFSTIATQTSERFKISLTQVNWLANIVCGIYLLAAPLVPWLLRRTSIRGVCLIAAVFLLVGGWLRYASISSSLSPASSYALLFIGSALVGVAQCFVQVVPPAFSETWFGLSSRTTVTMIIAVANPFGGAISSLLAPGVVSTSSDLSSLLLIMALVSSAGVPLALLIGARPPSPPTKSAETRLNAETESLGMWKTSLVLLGVLSDTRVNWRQRLDFGVIAFLFTIIVGFFDAFLTLTNQIFEPVGYSSNMAGYIGAAVIVSGLIAAIVCAPLLDRYFPFRLALCAKVLVPVIGISFFALTYAVGPPPSLGAIFTLAVLLGSSSFTMLPIALELAAEVVWRVAGPDTTSGILYMLANGWSVVTVVAMGALRANSEAIPPFNMRKALMLEGIMVLASSIAIFTLQGRQTRKRTDMGMGA